MIKQKKAKVESKCGTGPINKAKKRDRKEVVTMFLVS